LSLKLIETHYFSIVENTQFLFTSLKENRHRHRHRHRHHGCLDSQKTEEKKTKKSRIYFKIQSNTPFFLNMQTRKCKIEVLISLKSRNESN
jgi:hypothetical protein